MFKKLISISMLVLCMLMLTVPALAVDNSENIGLATWEELKWNNESNISPYGTTKPKEIWNIATDGIYSFKGTGVNGALYSEYLITGKISYIISVNNRRSDTLTIEVYKKGLTDTRISIQDISGGATSAFTVSGLSSSDKIYVKYLAPVNCDGTIRQGNKYNSYRW